LKYYQWINFVLLLQALFFSLPRIIWQSFNDQIGLSLGNLVDAANKYESLDGEKDRGTGMYHITYICRPLIDLISCAIYL
jgi:hypothetical protein